MQNRLLAAASILLSTATIASPQVSQPVLSPDTKFVETFCRQVESYQPGSQHYLVCLESGHRLLAAGATGPELIEAVCDELSDLFYEESSVARCYQDGNALLGE